MVGARATDPTSSRGDDLAWTTLAGAARHVARGRTARVGAPVAAIVGTVLSAANRGSAILAGRIGPVALVRLGVNYAVPFLVASWGVLSTHRRRADGNNPNGRDVSRA